MGKDSLFLFYLSVPRSFLMTLYLQPQGGLEKYWGTH
jgi:hypothetical protein